MRTPSITTCRGVPLRILDCHYLANSMGNSWLRLIALHVLGKVVGALRVSLYFNAKLATARVVCLTCEGGHKYGGLWRCVHAQGRSRVAGENEGAESCNGAAEVYRAEPSYWIES